MLVSAKGTTTGSMVEIWGMKAYLSRIVDDTQHGTHAACKAELHWEMSIRVHGQFQVHSVQSGNNPMTSKACLEPDVWKVSVWVY